MASVEASSSGFIVFSKRITAVKTTKSQAKLSIARGKDEQ